MATMRKILKSTSLILLFLLLTPAVYGQSLEKLAQKLEKGLKAKSNTKLAILNFPYHNGKLSNGSSIVQERLTTFIAGSGKIEVIERNLLKKVLEEMKLEATGLIDEKTTKEIGKILGVGAIVTGTLNDLTAGQVEINARVIQTETGKILTAGQAIVNKTWADDLSQPPVPEVPKTGEFLGKPLVQIAILLDTSSSMDGLIEQAKTQLWKIVNEMASSEKGSHKPELQVSLFEYGNSRLSSGEGYVRQILPLTHDLDKVSEQLFALTTSGGEEYCGTVIQNTVNNLEWDKHDDVYKTIFIAGNEPFTQGSVDFRGAVLKAVQKGIMVNTIFCGNRQEGIATQWEAGAKLGHGEYFAIDQAAPVAFIAAPQDNEIQSLGNQLNQTFIPYGQQGAVSLKRQAIQDEAMLASPAAAVERQVYKSKAQYGRGASSWDIVSSVESKQSKIEDLKEDALPQEMRKMSMEDRKKYVQKKSQERKELQDKINALNTARTKYIEQKQKESATQGNKTTLDQAIISALRSQAGKKNFKFSSH